MSRGITFAAGTEVFTRMQLQDLVQAKDFLTLRKLVLTPCKCGTKLGLLPTLIIDHATLHLLDSMPLGAMILTKENTILGLPLASENYTTDPRHAGTLLQKGHPCNH